jgi:hypothetical protein
MGFRLNKGAGQSVKRRKRILGVQHGEIEHKAVRVEIVTTLEL